MSGKTRLCQEILQQAARMFECTPEKMIVAYGQHQPIFLEMNMTIPKLILHEGLPSRAQIEEWSIDSEHTVLLLDDMMSEVTKSEDSINLFCVTAHHRKITVLFLTQNLYMPGKYSRTISLNCHYALLYKNARDSRQIVTFGSQVFPGKPKYFKEAYDKATTVPYRPLLVDMHPGTPDKYRLRTNILPHQDTIVYIPNV